MSKTAITMLASSAVVAPAALAQLGSAEYPTFEAPASVRNGYAAEDLLDAEVRGQQGRKIGQIEDLIIGPDGQLRRLVVSVNEGVFGTGGRRLAVKWEDAEVRKADNDVRYVGVPVTEQNVGDYGIFRDKPKAVEGKAREWRAHELLGDYVDLKDYNYYGSVNDLLFDREGRLQAISAIPELQGSSELLYAAFRNEGWEPGDANYVIPYTQAQVAEVLPDAMSREARAGTGEGAL